MKIEVERPTNEKLDQLGVNNWPIWSKEKSVFDWEYHETETCYILEGHVRVTAKNSDQVVEINKGDLVTFPKGLKCTWNVLQDVRKHYKFG